MSRSNPAIPLPEAPAKRKRSVKREFEEIQRLNVLANRALFLQSMEGLEEQALIYFRNFGCPKWPRRRYWLLSTERLTDLRDECIESVLRSLNWFKAQIAKVEKDRIDYD